MAHIVCLANAGIFAYTVVMHSTTLTLFDATWVPEGFCVSNREVPYWNSHDMCMYFDTVGSIIAGLCYLALKDTPGMGPANELVKFNVFGIFAHGLAHGAFGKAIRDNVVPENPSALIEDLLREYQEGNFEMLFGVVKYMLVLVIFWVGLLKASMPQSSVSKVVVPLALVSTILNMVVPPQFGFTFVQTVLLFAFSLNQLMRPTHEKTIEYARYPMYVGVPLSFISWLESTQCENFVIHYGGHLLYDAWVPISMITFYLVCYMDVQKKNQTTTTQQKIKSL